MDVTMEGLQKQVHDLTGMLSTLVKKNGTDGEKGDGVVHTDAIQKDELEKFKADTLELIEKGLAKSKAPIIDPAEEEKKKEIPFGTFLKAVKENDHEVLKGAMTEASDAQGGYTVPTGQETRIFGALNDPATVISKTTPYAHGQIDGFTKNIPKWLTDMTVAWADEQGTKSNTKPTFTQKQSILHKMYALVTLSDEYLEDNTANITKQLAMLAGENFAVEMERIILAGNTGAGDPFMGVGYDAAVTTAAQAGANLTYPDLLTIINNTNLEKYHVGAELYMRRAVLSLIMGLVDGNARPLWNISSINGKMQNTVLGVPINLSSQTVATHILYGNWKNVLVGYKAGGLGKGVRVTYSNTAVDNDAANYWITDQSGYRFVLRRSVVVVNPTAFFKMTEVA